MVPAGKCNGPDKIFFIKFTCLQCNQFSQPIVMWVWEWKEAAAITNMDFAYWTHKLWKDKVSIFLHVDPGSQGCVYPCMCAC